MTAPGPRAAVDYILSLDLLGMRFGLERMHRLLAALGDPHRAQPVIQIVGTNGKTSTARITAAILRAHGLRTGTYVSPHVVDWNERVEIDGEALDPEAFADAVMATRDAAATLGDGPDDAVTQFEVLTAAAFFAFAKADCQVAVVEAGLGGRYDATNVVDGGRVTVLTNIALEHTALLGSTEEAIAGEKLAVAPDGSDRLVVGRLSPAARPAVAAQMQARRLSGWRCGVDFDVHGRSRLTVTCGQEVYDRLELPLRGAFQHDNLACGVAAARRFRDRPLNLARVREAVAAVRVPGRLELFPGQPDVMIDGAHNPAGMAALARSLPTLTPDGVVAVVSLLDDKDADGMVAELAPACRAMVATRSRHRRARDPAAVAAAARHHGVAVEVCDDGEQALDRARERAGPDGIVLVCGSLYLLADLRPALVAAAAR